MDQTDSVYVEKLRPGVTADFLSLYFESQAGGNTVTDVTMLSEDAAKVSFASCDCKCPDVILSNSCFLLSSKCVSLSSTSRGPRPQPATQDAAV